MNRAKIQDYIDQREDQRADLYHYEATGQNQFTLNGHHYQLLVSYRDGFNGDEFAKRFSNILSKYDYIVGDWGYGQLRLRGFYDDQSLLFRPERGQERIEDYLFEDCNFGCPYFVVQNDDVQLPKRRSHRRRTSFRERRKPLRKESIQHRHNQVATSAGEGKKHKFIIHQRHSGKRGSNHGKK